MAPETLEQKTDEKQGIKNSETITARCGYCGKTLQIPKNITLEKNREYEGFYVSPCGVIYCNEDRCFWMFTED